MKVGGLPEDAAARRRLKDKLAGPTVRPPRGDANSPLAPRVSGRWYEFPENERGIKAVPLDFASASPAPVVRTADVETRTPFGNGSWAKGRGGFADGVEGFLGVPPPLLVAASGARAARDTFVIKLVACETPFYTTPTPRFGGDRLLPLDSGHNVSFGRTKLRQLIGVAGSGQRTILARRS